MLWRHWGTPHSGAADRSELPRADRRHDVLVLSGGGLLGAAQVGMLRPLARSGWRPDAIVGTSAGALNGAWMAAGFGVDRVDQLEEIWMSLQERGVFPDRSAAQLWRVIARRSAVQGAETLKALIERCCPVDRLEEFEIPVHVSATGLASGQAVWLEDGPARPALLASSSIPGVVPPVEVDGRMLVDGGVVANVPVTRAVEIGATRIVCLDVSGDLATTAAPTTALGVLLHSYTACRIALANHELRQAAADVDQLWRIRPDVPADLRPTHWRRIPELIEAGERAGERFLEACATELFDDRGDAADPARLRGAHHARHQGAAHDLALPDSLSPFLGGLSVA